jgi:OOP family OmpA-OmpF porin
VGAHIMLTDRLSLRLDGRVLAPPAVLGPIVSIGDEAEFGGPDFEVLGALSFAFGELEKPRVEVRKEVVVVKQAPPPPPPDPDNDGIAGDDDKCPNEAEDKDGHEDTDGCPDPDNDGDSVADADDKCPMQPENRNGVDDEDGCPEEDTDGDGFLGTRDKCPDAPETKNNFKDDDGCPDEIPPAVKKFTGAIQGINFKSNSAVILKGSFVVLDRAADLLKEYPDIKVEISGHTDDRGKPELNKALSQKRAEAVRDYLFGKGIAADRLTAVGYGSDRPIDDNKRSAGRAKNRRIEFNLINDTGAKPPTP